MEIVHDAPCPLCNIWHGAQACAVPTGNPNTLRVPAVKHRAVNLHSAEVEDVQQAPAHSDAASDQLDIGSMSTVCQFCRARFWPGENINCCYKGSLTIAEPAIPEPLMNIIYSAPVRKQIRSYNMAMAMASVGHSKEGFPDGVFVLSGRSYHRMGTLVPRDSATHNFAQIYLLDTADATDRRSAIFGNRLAKKHLRELHDMMLLHNPLVSQFRRVAAGAAPELVWTSEDDIFGMQMGAIVSAPGFSRPIIIHRQRGEHQLERIDDGHPLYHTLAYPLLFPVGTRGWCRDMKRSDLFTSTQSSVTLTDYGRYILMHRDHPSHMQKCGNLALEFYCDLWAQQEARAAMFHLNPTQQAKYRMGRKCTVDDQLAREGDLTDVTVPAILPSSFVGSAKWYHMLYLDALALPQRFHCPDLFITFTCNPKWPEVKAALLQGQKWQDHPDIVARVFYLKLKNLMADIVEKEIFGTVQGFVWRIEWQARGLPHAHILIILVDALKSPRLIDAVVSAEVPDPDLYPDLHALVEELMIHTPCDDNPKAGCRPEAKPCKRHFPKDMSRTTVILSNKMPKYRRRGRYQCKVNGRIVSDDWVVPHSPFLLLKYRAHINVEIASHIKTFKYVYKYVLKPPDKAAVAINEIAAHLSGRLLSCSEAVWRFFGLPLHKEWPPVIRLHVHLPNEQCVVFDPTVDTDSLEDVSECSTSTLLQWFELNSRDATARRLLYAEVPEHYVWSSSEKMWSPRQRGFSVGRMLSVSSRNQELFALKRLLHVVRGASSWVDLLTVDGYCYTTFQDACGARGMLADDSDVIEAFQELAQHSCSLEGLRREFAIILLNRTCHNARLFFDLFAVQMCKNGEVNPQNCMEALWCIEDVMAEHGRSLEEADFGFKLSQRRVQAADALPPCWRCHSFALDDCISQRDQFMQHFTAEQHAAMQTVVDAIGGSQLHLMCVLASGGCGKSLFVNGVTWHLRSQGKIVINVAASALAATLLPGGRTAHSAFRIPIPTTSDSYCGLKTAERELLRQCSVVFWDEVSMVSRDVADTLDKTLREVMKAPDRAFGGKPICFLGDFKQLLPVTEGSKYPATIKDSSWWPECHIMRFTKNWRAVQNPDYCRFLEDVGNGNLLKVPVPVISCVDSVEQLIQNVYGHDMTTSKGSLNLIMAFTLDTCSKINKLCLDAIPSPAFDACAFDDTKDNKQPDCYTPDYVASLQLHGVPPALLTMKVGARYMIIKNYDVQAGVCNGTMCELLKCTKNLAQVKLLTGTQQGRVIALPRCSCHVSPENSGLPFAFTRVQFPLAPAYCVSVHKSQGQTLGKVGIVIDMDSFAHGQVYTAFSRTSGWPNISVLLPKNDTDLINLVYKHML